MVSGYVRAGMGRERGRAMKGGVVASRITKAPCWEEVGRVDRRRH